MTKDQAIQAMKRGKKVTHTYFTSDEWIQMVSAGMYQFEDGGSQDVDDFWKTRNTRGWLTGWEIFNG